MSLMGLLGQVLTAALAGLFACAHVLLHHKLKAIHVIPVAN